jgi:hypothetical protein
VPTSKFENRKSRDVEAFFGSLKHPSKRALLALREIILAADGSIAEGIKWNVPSFRTTEYFATLHPRAKDGIQVIMHLGARARGKSARGVGDPTGILEWASPDRALARFQDLNDLRSRRTAFQKLVRQWIGCL